MAPNNPALLAPAIHSLQRPLCLTPHARAWSSRSACRVSTGIRRHSQQVQLLKLSVLRARRYPSCTGVTPTQVRRRSSWGFGRDGLTGWGWRLKSSWHHPGCKWVRSEGPPDKVPRDRDCPACQEEERRPQELSQRELIWQRKMEALRARVEKNPYEALFGASHRLLRGNFFPKSMMNPSSFPWWSREATDTPSGITKSTNDSPPTIKLDERDLDKDQQQGLSGPPKFYDVKSHRLSSVQSTGPRPGRAVHASSIVQETIHFTHSPGFDKPQELQFDPISMRMVPKPKGSSVKKESVGDDHVAEEAQIPVKKHTKAATPPNKESHLSEATTDLGIIEKQMLAAREDMIRDRDFLAREGFISRSTKLPAESLKSALPKQGKTMPPTQESEPVLDSIQTTSIPLKQTALRDQTHSSGWKFNHAPRGPVSAGSAFRPQQPASIPRSQFFGNTKPQDMPKTKRMLEQSWAKEAASNETKSTQDEQQSETTLKKVKDSQPHEFEIPPDKVNSAQRSDVEISKPPAVINVPPSEPLSVSKPKKGQLDSESVEGKVKPAAVGSWLSGKEFSPSAETARKEIRERRWKDKVPSKVLKFPLVEKEKPLAQMTLHEIEKHREKLLNSWSKKVAAKATADAASQKLAEEVKAQKLAMAAYENRHHRTESAPTLATKATADKTAQPDPTGLKSDAKTVLATDQQIQDETLAANIERIYEAEYGKIDEDHRQAVIGQLPLDFGNEISESPLEELKSGAVNTTIPASSSPSPAENATAQTNPQQCQQQDPALYLILAYDPSNQSIYTASASSSFTPPTGETLLSVSDSLSRLHHPAKFVPLLAQHQANGYDIVSASKHLLVFKRLRAAPAPGAPPTPPPAARATTNPIDPTIQSTAPPPPPPQVGNFASPTGFVNHDSLGPTPRASPANPVMRKAEPVFSGSGKVVHGHRDAEALHKYGKAVQKDREDWRRRHRGRRRGRVRALVKRMVFVGAWVAACCYAIGVVMEYFRTGGSGEREERGWGGELKAREAGRRLRQSED